MTLMKYSRSFRAMPKITNNLLTIPNIISLIRLLLGVPLCIALYNDYYIQILTLTALVLVSDFADGYLSRLLNQRSHFGQIIDPCTDFVLIIGVCVTLTLKSLIPSWYIALLGCRYLLIGTVLYRYQSITKQTPLSIQSGKISICFTSLTMISGYFQSVFPNLYHISLLISLQMMLVSTIDYYQTYPRTTN
jgi:phosphatidylglycerophosphate synthase